MALSKTDIDVQAETPQARADRNANHHESEFSMLGFDHGVYYYLPKGSGQIVHLKANQHVEANLIEIAPRQFWEEKYNSGKGADWKSAANALIRRQHAIGVYNVSRVRGRGAWWDKDHAVVHVGDHVIIKGKALPLSTPSKYIYEASQPYPISPENPLDAKSAYQLIEICKLISWEKPINAYYLAGWVALAPVGGALNWRPHIWITAAAESGKSWVMREIVGRILNGIAIGSQSCTTEPAIRGELNNGSLPVIFDEAESKSKVEKLRMDAVVGLARAASTEGGDPIMKANPDGSVRKTFIRSMFSFSSISYPLTKPEDMRRITPLGIVKDGNIMRFEQLKMLTARIITDEFCARFPARSIAMIPIIRQNSRIFSAAIIEKFGSQGMGDQYGMLLAGAWSLFSDRVATQDEAEKWVAERNAEGAWIEQKAQAEESDEVQCLAYLMQSVIRSQGPRGVIEMSVAELMRISSSTTGDLRQDWAVETLGRYGFRGDVDGMVISSTHGGVGGILKDTPWARNWARTLGRLPGARSTEGGVRFGAVKTRGIEIPYPADPDDEDA